MKVLMTKANGYLIPEGEEAIKSIAKLKSLESVMVNITMPRNIGNHRRYFSLINELFDMQENYEDEEIFRYALTVGTGYCDLVEFPNGIKSWKARSIAFEKMPEDEFKAFFSRTIDVAIKKFGIDEESINRILNYV